jgi:hypothetical protein
MVSPYYPDIFDDYPSLKLTSMGEPLSEKLLYLVTQGSRASNNCGITN